MFRPLLRALPLLGALLAAGCGLSRGGPFPEAPPGDFHLALEVRGLPGWPWEGTVRAAADGTVDYAVSFPGPPRGDRRGRATLDAEVLGALWRATAASGLFAGEPVPAGMTTGPVVAEALAGGLAGRRCGDPERDPALAALLEAIRAAAPERLFKPIPQSGP
jgi:hypothetical protein